MAPSCCPAPGYVCGNPHSFLAAAEWHGCGRVLRVRRLTSCALPGSCPRAVQDGGGQGAGGLTEVCSQFLSDGLSCVLWFLPVKGGWSVKGSSQHLPCCHLKAGPGSASEQESGDGETHHGPSDSKSPGSESFLLSSNQVGPAEPVSSSPPRPGPRRHTVGAQGMLRK